MKWENNVPRLFLDEKLFICRNYKKFIALKKEDSKFFLFYSTITKRWKINFVTIKLI